MQDRTTFTLNKLIENLIRLRDMRPDNGVKKVFFNEDKMNGDLDRWSVNNVIQSSDGNFDLYTNGLSEEEFDNMRDTYYNQLFPR